MDGWKVSLLPFSVVMDERWNGWKCSRNEMGFYPLPTTLYVVADESTGTMAIV